MPRVENVSLWIAGITLILASPALAQTRGTPRNDPEASAQAFRRVAEVLRHPRCMNCHTVTDFPRQGDGRRRHDQLVMRGNSTSADFFLNGVRDDVQYYRDLYNVEQIEAIKGPNAMIFGRGGGC